MNAPVRTREHVQAFVRHLLICIYAVAHVYGHWEFDWQEQPDWVDLEHMFNESALVRVVNGLTPTVSTRFP